MNQAHGALRAQKYNRENYSIVMYNFSMAY